MKKPLPEKPKRSRGVRDDPHGFLALRRALGLTDRQVAELAGPGVTHTAVQGLDWTTESGKPSASHHFQAIAAALAEAKARVERGEPAYPAKPISAPVIAPKRVYAGLHGRVPVYEIGLDQAGRSVMTEYVAANIRIPEHMDGAPVLAVQTRALDMIPKYAPGDMLLANPRRLPQVGSGVILKSAKDDTVLIREFVAETETEWALRRYGEHPDVERVPKREFPSMAAIQDVIPWR